MTENRDRTESHELATELNITTAIVAAREISQELNLENLLVKVIKIFQVSIKAQKIYLLEKQNQQWSLLAGYDAKTDELAILPSFCPLQIPISIINRVAQTKTSLMIEDAANTDNFNNDWQVKFQQLKSILCLPLQERDFNSGFLYLENHEITGAFPLQLHDNLKIITAQTAISINNARQYQQALASEPKSAPTSIVQTQEWQQKLRDLETALEESRAELLGILGIAKDAIISVDSSQRICRFNQGAETLFGYQAEEVLGKPLDILIPVRAVNPHRQYIKDFGDDSVSPSRMMGERRSVCGRRRDGSEFPAEASITKFQLGQQQIYTAILRDISDRKAVEADLQRAKELAESANRAKSQFLANMSHELRTPLNAILGFTQLMIRDSSLNASQQEHLAIISRSGEHLLELINDILTMSKIEAGQLTAHNNSFDLYWLLDSLKDMLSLRAESKGLQLIVERSLKVPQYINSDESKLRQVLINLLGNAIKFTQLGWVKLQVGIKKQPKEINPKTECLLFEVEDTGSGIAPEEIDSLFQAFSQTKTGRNSQEGTGLGLSISRQFVRLLGGSITLSSTLNRGTLVKFDIQVQLAKSSEIVSRQLPQKVIGLAPSQPEYRILVVEDKSASRQFLVELLKSVGFAVRAAANGEEAIAEWDSWLPHLIWMDMRMPVMDGYEATRIIKSKTDGSRTKILALTASAFEEEKAVVLEAGCDDFVRKPFREEILFEKMAEHIGVRYIYVQSSEPENTANCSNFSTIQTSDLAAMPQEWIAKLQKAAMQARDKSIVQLIEEIPQQHDALAKNLKSLVDNFHFDKIISLTRSYF